MERSPLLEVQGLSKEFGGVRAVADVSFAVREGQIKAMIGPKDVAQKPTLCRRVPTRVVLEFGVARSPVTHEGIVSGCKVNWLIDGLCGERLPTINLAHIDLS